VKFPRLNFFWEVISDLIHHDGVGILIDPIRENWDEYLTWRRFKSDYLAPVYFSIGLVNLQKRIDGPTPTQEELTMIWRELVFRTGGDISKTNLHNLLDVENFRRTEKGLVWIDYGSWEKMPMRKFLLTWDNLFKKLLLN
jgi:hypothetical protein